MSKMVLSPDGRYVTLEESGLMRLGIKTDEQIELHNKIQAQFNEEKKKEKQRKVIIDAIIKTVKDVVKKNNLEREYMEMESRGMRLIEEIAMLMSINIDKDSHAKLHDCFIQMQEEGLT